MARKETQPSTELGKQLEKERVNRGLTKEEWCVELGISKPTYLAWLTRPVDIELVNIRKMALVMGITMNTVFEWIEAEAPIMAVPSWFRRPIDINAVMTTLEAGFGHPGRKAA